MLLGLGCCGALLGSFWVLSGVYWRLLWCSCGLSVAPLIFKTCLRRPPHPVFYGALLHVARVRLRNLLISSLSVFLLASSLTLIFQIVVFPPLEALGVDFEVPSGPSHSWNPILSYTCDGFMAARRLPRSVRRSAALLPLAWSCPRRSRSWLYRKLPQA